LPAVAVDNISHSDRNGKQVESTSLNQTAPTHCTGRQPPRVPMRGRAWHGWPPSS